MKPPSTFRPNALVSFPFFALGLLSFIGLLGWLVAQPGLLLEPERALRPLAFVHLTLLGWLLPFVFGAAYQLIPVVAESPLRSRPLAYAHLALHLVAAPGLFSALLAGDFANAGRWGAVVAAGVLLGVGNLVATANRRSRWTPDNIGLMSALFWVSVTVALGVVVALGRVGHVTAFAPEHVLRLHTVCGLVGFFLITLVAVSFKLVPMFLLSPVRTRKRAWPSIVLLNLGLVLLGPALLGNFPLLVAGAALLIALGVGCFLAEIAVLFRQRMRALDWPLRCYFIGIAMLAPVTTCGVLGALAGTGAAVWRPERPAFTVFTLGVFGVLTPAILGMAGKILPFLGWQWRYADHIGRARVPLVSELFHPALLRAQFCLLVPAVGSLAAGIALESAPWIRAAGILFLLSVATLAANAARLASHLIHPRLQPLIRPAPAGTSLSPITSNFRL